MPRPLVAVGAARVPAGQVASWDGGGEGTGAEYLHGLRRAGLTPAVIAPGAGDDPAETLAPFAGLVLTGGADVDPAAYGATPHPATYGVDAERDRREIELVHRALAAGVPLLAICRGAQILNVALGGTLHQHLADHEGLLAHGVPVGSGVEAHHPVGVETSSRLAALGGLQRCVSIHHQAIDAVAPGLVVTARSADGVIEAVETPPGGSWCVAVQWHPERSAAEDPGQQAVFDLFAAGCHRRGPGALAVRSSAGSRSPRRQVIGGVPEPSPVTPLTLTDRVAAGGDGVGHLGDGRVVFVEGALPGETVTAEITDERRDFARARVVTVDAAHPGRVEPPCPNVARGCGGCQLQHAEVVTQRRLKEMVVADALRRIGRLHQAPVPVTVVGPDRGYRTTVHLAVDAQGRPSYRRRHHHDHIPVDSCLVTHPALEELITAGRFPGHRRVTLRVGVAGGERLAVLDRAGPAPAVPADVTVVGPRGRARLHEDAGGRRWRVSARAFFQAGPAAAGALVEAVDAALGPSPAPGGALVDLYAGVGLLGGCAAARRPGTPLVAVEQHREAAGDARANLSDLPAQVVTAEVGDWRARPAGAVIADPARPGLGRPGVAAVVATGAPRAVLVSCDPASLGRDAALLDGAGWSLTGVTLVDAFPHTAHVEVVSRFDRRPAAAAGDFPPSSNV